MPKMSRTLWGSGYFYDRCPVGLEPQVRVRGARGALPVADEATARVAAVDKIEEKRKPEDFIGHRNRTPGTIIPTLI